LLNRTAARNGIAICFSEHFHEIHWQVEREKSLACQGTKDSHRFYAWDGWCSHGLAASHCFALPASQVPSTGDSLQPKPDWPGISRPVDVANRRFLNELKLGSRRKGSNFTPKWTAHVFALPGIHELLATAINRADLDLRMTLFSQV